MDLSSYLIGFASEVISNISIVLDEADVRKVFSALDRVEKRARVQSNEVPRLLAIDYYQRVVGNIMSQSRMSGYPRYHPRYEAWKAHRSSGGFWNLAGDLVRAMSHRRVPDLEGAYAWFAGVPAGVLDSGNKSWFSRNTSSSTSWSGRRKEIAWYGRIMEEGSFAGGQDHPARPIFEPTFKEYNSSGVPVQRGEQGLTEVSNEWR